jgi:hypothetical protein
MRSVVVVPTYRRPEFLALSLEKLELASGLDLDVRIYADVETDLESVSFVRDTYFPTATIFLARPHPKAPSGTWNILNAIAQGCATGADLIYHVEEDVMVRPNFFAWHQAQHVDKLYLATCGRGVKFFLDNFGDLYSNPGSCLSRRLVEQVIPHLCEEYYADQEGYLNRHFEPWPEMSKLDDGLIRRVIRKMGGRVLSANPAVCAHQGFRYYNKLSIYKNEETSIEKRIARLRQILASVKPEDRYARDFEPF